MRLMLVVLFSSIIFSAQAKELKAVQVYTDNMLLDLIKENKHLSQVVIDDCQLVQDIEARALKASMPSYEFLWGDMLAFGVCIKKNVKLGLHYMQKAADQGLPEALEQLGRYYHIGKFMQPDLDKAIVLLKAASDLDNLKAQIRLAEIYNKGDGSPLDYPILYSQLHHSVTSDRTIHKKITKLLAGLAEKMPERIVNEAKRNNY